MNLRRLAKKKKKILAINEFLIKNNKQILQYYRGITILYNDRAYKYVKLNFVKFLFFKS